MADGQVIYPGVPKVIEVTIAAGNVSGTALHWMGTTPKVGKPNPSDPAGNNAIASADATTVTVTLDIAQAMDITFTVIAIIR